MRANASPSNLLMRQEASSLGSSALSAAHLRLDASLQSFTLQATDSGNLISMMAGSLVYRMARTSLLSMGLGRGLASVLALSGEVTAFRATGNSLNIANAVKPQEDIFDRRGWLTSLVHFASLKGAGVATLGQNQILAQAAQSLTMVAASQLTHALELTHKPEGSFLEQWVNAQVTNLALAAGSSFTGMLTGHAFHRMDRALDARSEAIALSRQASSRRIPSFQGLGILNAHSSTKPLPKRNHCFEQVLSPQDYFERFSGELQVDFLRKQGDRIESMNEEDMGRSLGLLYEDYIRDLPSTSLTRGALQQPVLEKLLRLDEVVGVFEHVPRTNRQVILTAAQAAMSPGSKNRYAEVKQSLRHFLDPNFSELLIRKEALGLEQGVAAVGSGDMMALLHLYRHRMQPGELSWRNPIRVIARTEEAATEINVQGTYKSNPSLWNTQINHLEDPAIEAVGPIGRDSRGLSQSEILSTYRVQFLNVPSRELYRVLTKDYIENLPRDAVLMEVIGGMIGPEVRGEYQATEAQPKPLLLPFELIRMALDRYGRQDVSVVSGGGYIPGKNLWSGKRAEMTFAGEERERGRAPAAEFIARLLAGPSLDNGFLAATYTHHQRSTELGKTLKNVTTLMAGLEAGRLARWISDAAQAAGEAKRYKPKTGIVAQLIRGATEVVNPQGEYETKIRNPIYQLMEGVLSFNEVGIKAHKATYRQEVRNDYWNCTEIKMEEVIRVFQAARLVNVHSPADMRVFLEREILRNPNDIASTRNPKRGIAQAIVEMWRDMGSPYQAWEVMPKITEEGVDSLKPLMRLYDYPAHPLERRRLHALFYDLFETFSGEMAQRPVEVAEPLLKALQDNVPELSPPALREVLEGKSQRSLDLLAFEVERLIALRETLSPADEVKRQADLVMTLRNALAEGFNLERVDHSLPLESPYDDVYILRLTKVGVVNPRRAIQHRVFIRARDGNLFKRLTEFGLFFRMFEEGSNIQVELSVARNEESLLISDLSDTLMTILGDYATQRKLNIRVRASYNTDRGTRSLSLQAQPKDRSPLNDEYFQRLSPLVAKLAVAEPGITAQDVRNQASHLTALIDSVLHQRASNLLLGYRGGVINKALKAALTRPERSTLIGIYDENGVLMDVVAVYRGNENRPRVICHHLMKEMHAAISGTIPSLGGITMGRIGHVVRRRAHAMGFGQLEDPPSEQYYSGIPLDLFLEHYPSTVDPSQKNKIRYRMLRLQSLPLEQALVGQVAGVNPGLLRLFMRDESNGAKLLAKSLLDYYDKKLPDNAERISEIINTFLIPYERNNRARLALEPLYQHFLVSNQDPH